MNVFVLKIIAIISMVLDHVKYAIPATKCFATEYLGRLALPIFAFLISEGFVHTHSRSKYMLRILIFALISQIPFYIFAKYLVHNNVRLNILFTFEMALIGLSVFDFFKKYEGMPKWLDYIFILTSWAFILSFSYYIHPDYSWYGVACVWLFYIFRNNKFIMSMSFIILVFIYYYINIGKHFHRTTYLSILFSVLPLLFILFYNGKQGKKMKYFFYVFYPLQFIILYGINYFLIK